MVRQRKKIKPRGVRNEPKATLTLTSCPDTRSPLVALPAEIQGIIINHLAQYRDLNHLCCTCKTLNAVVLPTLYHTIEVKVPLQWDRLPSLENLLASSSEGLRYTRCLRIVTKHHRQEDDSYAKVDKAFETDEEDVVEDESESGDGNDSEEEEDGLFRVYRPPDSASNALNAFIRVLLVKLPPQQLQTFWWEQACPVSTLTLSVVLKHQGASIHTLNFRENTGSWRMADLVKLNIEGLRTLGIAVLGSGDSLAAILLVRNHQNLRHLRLGSDEEIATEYAAVGYCDESEVSRLEGTQIFAKFMRGCVAALTEPPTPVVQLESLSLIGLDLHSFATGLIEPILDFNSLSILTLESCACLKAAFPLLRGAAAGKRKAKSSLRLHTFAIRHENVNDEFLQELEILLLSLKPLTHLHVLLEGEYDGAINIHKVLLVHGKCLRTLIWDERLGPRNDVREDRIHHPEDHKNLDLVAKHCPGLKALGISLDWKDIVRSERSHKKIASSFSQLSQLQTLNIRNLPVATEWETWLPNDYMIDGLASMLLDLVTKKARMEQAPALTTLAIGASTYGSARVGMGHYAPNSASTFLQLRIYHVNYDCRYRNSVSPKLHLIARGTPADAWGNAENLDIFTLYWLDGALQDPAMAH